MKSLSYCLNLLIIVLLPHFVFAQKYVNKEFSSTTGLPLNLVWAASHLTNANNLATVGNTYVTGQNTNMLITLNDQNGNQLWQKQYNNAYNLEDYAVAVTSDGNENIYLAGTSGDSLNNSLDVIVLQYNQSGTLIWTYTYNNNSANGDDVPTSIIEVDNDLYIACSSIGATTNEDITLIKLDASNGTETWVKRYDTHGYEDLPFRVTYNESRQNINVGGVAATANNLFDAIVLQYATDGTLEYVHASDYNVGIDQPTAFDTDTNGNVIIAGYYLNSNGDSNLSLISLDDTLGMNWHFTKGTTGYNSVYSDVLVDEAGNIYLTGFAEGEDNFYRVYTDKYSASGTKIWGLFYGVEGKDCFGIKLNLDIENNVSIVGYTDDRQGTYNILTLQYSNNGNLNFVVEEELPEHEQPVGVETDNLGSLYVHGVTSSIGGSSYTTTKYGFYSRDPQVFEDTIHNVKYIDNEILVKFNPAVVDTNFVNNKSLTFAKLKDIVSADVISEMNEQFEVSPNWGEMMAIKVFPEFSTNYTTAISRLGETIDVPSFWSIFSIEQPTGLSEININQNLENVFPDVEYSHPNLIGHSFAPNDPEYSKQASLAPTVSYPNAHVNSEDAWLLETGKSHIKVGVFDGGIKWKHEDFLQDQTDVNSSVVVDGYDLISNTTIKNTSYSDLDPNNHATPVAGLIGAVRNNNLGIAGIAGGDNSNNEVGVSLYSLRTMFPSIPTIPNVIQEGELEDAAKAIVESSINDPQLKYGYGLHVSNHSWGLQHTNQMAGVTYNIDLLEDAVHFANRMKVVVVASSGNNPNTNKNYPASFNDSWVLKVGGSDKLGFYNSTSTYGNGVDLVAPADPVVVYTIDKSDGSYKHFGGTSASAPHVSGASALLLSNFNQSTASINNLAPEDVEVLLQLTADDIFAPPATNGYDLRTGFGKLNISSALQLIEKPVYDVKHFSTKTHPTTFTTTIHPGSGSVELLRKYVNSNNQAFAKGTYAADVYKITAVVNTNLPSNNISLNHWARPSSSTTFREATPLSPSITPHEFDTIVNIGSNSVTLEGFVYRIKDQFGGFLGWIPHDLNPSNVEMSFSILTGDINASTKEEENSENFKLFPNPANEVVNINIPDYISQELEVEIYDNTSRVLVSKKITPENQHKLKLNISSLKPGVYLIAIKGDNSIEYQKLIVE